MSLTLTIAAMMIAAFSGVPALLLPRAARWGAWASSLLMVAAAGCGLGGAFESLSGGQPLTTSFPWPAFSTSLIGLDALSAFFLVPVFLIGGLGSLYGLGYWHREKTGREGRGLSVFWGLTVAGMALLLLARHTLVFLLGWELMALSAFFLVGAEDQRRESRQAAWLYLAAAHLCTLTLFAVMLVWSDATLSSLLIPVAAGRLDPGTLTLLFFLITLGFGVKAGFMPLHFWLPTAHAEAPTHVSALLSGVMIKMGIYGMVRFFSLLPAPPPAWGFVILGLGTVSAVLGVAFALGQHDIKRLLAYHSVENIGIILMGLGLALLGRSIQRPEWVALGMAGCLLHVWNHGVFKSLLFFGAGSVIKATHTRAIEQLGGLGRRMPRTGLCFLIGAAAICGLPPLNGFISELMLYFGLFRAIDATVGDDVSRAMGGAAAVAAPLLALTGALAVACFVKVLGAVFLGSPRTREASQAQESCALMTGVMATLALLCLVIGLAPTAIAPLLDHAVRAAVPGAEASLPSISRLLPLPALEHALAGLLAACLSLAILLRWRARRDETRQVVTWDCGYAAPTARMQYSASSLALSLVTLLRFALRPRTQKAQVAGLFPKPTSAHSHLDDLVLDRVLLPTLRRGIRVTRWFHRFQQGLTQFYVLYVLLAVLGMLLLLVPWDVHLTRWFTR